MKGLYNQKILTIIIKHVVCRITSIKICVVHESGVYIYTTLAARKQQKNRSRIKNQRLKIDLLLQIFD